MRKKIVSIIVPVFNEEEVITLFHQALINELKKIERFAFEIIYVNDGSADNTGNLLRELDFMNFNKKIINLSRNFGHQAALTCGLDNSSGDAAITIDSDLQHPPSLIAKLIEKWEQGYDIVYTIRNDNNNLNLFKRVSSKLFYKIINILSQTEVKQNAADFRLLSRKVIDILKNDLRERERFLRGLISWLGFRTVGVEFNVEKRALGRSKYTFAKMLKLGLTGIISFSNFPLKIGIFLGLMLLGFSLFYGAYSIIAGLVNGTAVPGWTTLMIFLMFFSSLQFLLIGLLGYYIGFIFNEVKGRPIYIISDIIKDTNDRR